MAQAQVNGSSLTSTQFGSFTEAKNNKGTMRANGKVSSSAMTSVNTPRPVVSSFASTVVDNGWVDPANSSGVFAHNHTKPISSLITTELAGLSNSTILTTGNDGDTIRSINKLETLRTRRFTTTIRNNKYNRFTNTFDSGFPVVATDTLATDNAANPTPANPGDLVYMVGGNVVYGSQSNSSYKPKTSA
jgi:hypothetical protein